jgi:hypothetical protein
MTGAALPSALAALDPAELAASIARLPEEERAVASDRLQEQLAFGAIAEHRGLAPDEVAKRYRRAVRRLHRRLRLDATWSSRPNEIPATEMDELYQEVKAKHGARDSDSLQRSQLAVAERYLADPAPLAAAFGRSVDSFAKYSNVEEPFYPSGRDALLQGRLGARRIAGTNDLAAWLIRLERAECDGLSYGYVDRELWPARTTGGVPFTDGRSARQAPRLDLLLVDADERTPVVTEVKVRGDQHPFYALIQLLMLAAQVVTEPQQERLREWYPGRFGDGDGRIDLCMLLAANVDRGRYRPRLFEIADELSGRLLDRDEVGPRVRRIACLDVRLEHDRLVFERRFVHQR